MSLTCQTSLAARFIMLWLHLAQHKSSLKVLMDLSFHFLLLGPSLQFHEDIKLGEVFNHLVMVAASKAEMNITTREGELK